MINSHNSNIIVTDGSCDTGLPDKRDSIFTLHYTRIGMKMKNDKADITKRDFSRRTFLGTVSATTAGLIAAPFFQRTKLFGSEKGNPNYLTQVAITQATTYDRTLIKTKVQHLFDSIGGIGDVVKAGNKVGIKINLTGGGGGTAAYNMWTHPEVLRSVTELILDCGVNAQDIYFVEALWNNTCYTNYGYSQVQSDLGVKMVDLNKVAPYAAFVDVPVGDKGFTHTSFKLNQILSDIDVYVSIPKMKQHAEGGVTCSLKNQIGITPITLNTIPTDNGRRGGLHSPTGGSSTASLPRSICDLNLARPVHLAVIDGVQNARGGEGTWNATWKPVEDHVLLAGKNPVSTDSVAAYFMGNDPEALKLQLPGGGQCDNYLELLHQKGIGTNQMSEIEIVGDGAGLITSVLPTRDSATLEGYQLCQNYPNPFNPSTLINFYLPRAEHVSVKVYNVTGQEIETVLEGNLSAGEHRVHWSPHNVATGMYICRMQAGKFSDAKKMIYQK